MAYLVKSENLLFILNPRTASTAISTHLGQNLTDGHWLPSSDLLNDDGSIRVQRKHSTIRDLLNEDLISMDYLKDLTKFTVVRNPFDSLVTLWTKKKYAYAKLVDTGQFFGNKIPNFTRDMDYIKDNTFSDWITNVFVPGYNGTNNSIHRKYINGVDKILRFEDLQNEFSALMNEVGIVIPAIPLINKTENKEENWRNYYNEAARKAVTECFSYDIEKFDYKFEED